jgi:hypothetical protein
LQIAYNFIELIHKVVGAPTIPIGPTTIAITIPDQSTMIAYTNPFVAINNHSATLA